MEDPGVERLREHFRRHNRKVLLLSTLTLLAAAAIWAALYFVAWWLFLLGGVVVKPLDWHPHPGRMARVFLSCAALLCFLAWIDRRLRPNQAPRDSTPVFEHLLDLLLAVPRMTLSIFGTARAAARLDEHELRLAWNLLRRMSDAGEPLPLHAVPLEIPHEAERQKILLALQFSDVIEMRRARTGPVLAFAGERARLLAQERVRLR